MSRIFSVSLWLLGLGLLGAELLAVSDAVIHVTGWSVFPACALSGVILLTPVVNVCVGIYGAMEVWNWPWYLAVPVMFPAMLPVVAILSGNLLSRGLALFSPMRRLFVNSSSLSVTGATHWWRWLWMPIGALIGSWLVSISPVLAATLVKGRWLDTLDGTWLEVYAVTAASHMMGGYAFGYLACRLSPAKQVISGTISTVFLGAAYLLASWALLEIQHPHAVRGVVLSAFLVASSAFAVLRFSGAQKSYQLRRASFFDASTVPVRIEPYLLSEDRNGTEIDTAFSEYLAAHPEFEYPSSGIRHPAVLATTEAQGWLMARFGGPLPYWQAMLRSAQVWFMPGYKSLELKVFRLRLEGHANVCSWNQHPEFNPLSEEYGEWWRALAESHSEPVCPICDNREQDCEHLLFVVQGGDLSPDVGTIEPEVRRLENALLRLFREVVNRQAICRAELVREATESFLINGLAFGDEDDQLFSDLSHDFVIEYLMDALDRTPNLNVERLDDGLAVWAGAPHVVRVQIGQWIGEIDRLAASPRESEDWRSPEVEA